MRAALAQTVRDKRDRVTGTPFLSDTVSQVPPGAHQCKAAHGRPMEGAHPPPKKKEEPC